MQKRLLTSRIHCIFRIWLVLMIHTGLNLPSAIAQVPEHYHGLINSERKVDTIDLFSIGTRLELEKQFTEEFEIMDICNRQMFKVFEIQYFGSVLYADLLIYKYCGEGVSEPSLRVSYDLKFFVFSNDSITTNRGESGDVDSVANWVYEYYNNKTALFTCYVPDFSRFAIVCDDDYDFSNLNLVIKEGIKGYLRTVEEFSVNYYNISLERQGKEMIEIFKKSIPLQFAIAISDNEETPPPSPPFESSADIVDSLSARYNVGPSIRLPAISRGDYDRTPYEDSITAAFSTTWGYDGEYIPYKMWKCQDTITIKREGALWLVDSDSIEELVVEKFLMEDYYLGEQFSDGRIGVYFYQENKFVLRNDTLYAIYKKNSLPADSITRLAVRHKILKSEKSPFLDILNENTYYQYDVLFYKGIGCEEIGRLHNYYSHKVNVENYWETEFGTFFKIVVYNKTDFSSDNCTYRTEYYLNDKFEFYGIGSDHKRIEAFKLDQLQPDMEKYKRIYCGQQHTNCMK